MPVSIPFSLILLKWHRSHSREARVSSFSQRKPTALKQRWALAAVNRCENGGSQPPRWPEIIPTSWAPRICHHLSYCTRIICESHRLQRRGDEIKLKKDCGFIAGLIQSLSLPAFALGEASCHVVRCPMEGPAWQGAAVFSPTAHKEPGKPAATSWRHSGNRWRDPCSGKRRSVPTASGDLRPTHSSTSELEGDRSPAKPSDETAALLNSFTRPQERWFTQLSCSQISPYRNCEIKYRCCFKVLSFGVICHTTRLGIKM